MWQINGCHLLTNNHSFVWAGSTTDDNPVADVQCGCGAFIMKANTGDVVPGEYLEGQIRLAQSMMVGG